MEILYAFIEEDKHNFLINKYLNISGNEFKEKILRYRRWQDAQLSLLGRILLKYGLNTFYDLEDIEIDFTLYSKPFLRKQNIYFNISHAKNLTVCGIAKFPIGIDVEFLDEKINYTDFRSHMTKNEFEKINNSGNKIQSFFKYWTEKEAVIKAHGKGLSIPLKSFEVFEEECLIDFEKFYLRDISLSEEYICSVAANQNEIIREDIQIQQVNLNTLQ
jgi:4'-phosphopantetheinyl transferase